jgi:hypothetical protein
MSENDINNVLFREQDKEENDVQDNSRPAEAGWPLQKLERRLVNGGSNTTTPIYNHYGKLQHRQNPTADQTTAGFRATIIHRMEFHEQG